MLFKLSKTQQITGNIYVVRSLISNFFIYSDFRTTICFDTGFIPSVVNRELKKINIEPKSVSHVFLTYPSFYHAGCIKLFKNADIYFSAETSLKKSGKGMFSCKSDENEKYKKLKDGDVVDVDGIRIKSIVFPKHKLGSISYMVNDDILFI
ncbi:MULTISPECIES: MBL fold metallo-hydrolase [Clostridium]|uniref:Metallo-beta-lactamase domain-containing protein n=4 Tax=Clostridium TaxID=1485 RepID=D8GLZ8_CLOLD|nr:MULTISPECIES: MBL fold metallo-hydrolase [Clostridium]ADK15572.1 conserved hypothetical protein [Clostridium ljungdahlii DSM 13528]AGY74811.1 MBL fold metallo-hydrolase [Clostridium autoethanogenum DSM 10061]ALU34989.1 Beta-lactamase-like [Clostridium autoethanogenum DSM 10061]OAA85422.1 hypothetical protein WX45_00387 [Clostridium ljungdahlii DSM 13528]OAA93940.1 hypothetical protein WX73_03850 [Clostridium coskatii]